MKNANNVRRIVAKPTIFLKLKVTCSFIFIYFCMFNNNKKKIKWNEKITWKSFLNISTKSTFTQTIISIWMNVEYVRDEGKGTILTCIIMVGKAFYCLLMFENQKNNVFPLCFCVFQLISMMVITFVGRCWSFNPWKLFFLSLIHSHSRYCVFFPLRI
jgi:hypothetical protein